MKARSRTSLRSSGDAAARRLRLAPFCWYIPSMNGPDRGLATALVLGVSTGAISALVIAGAFDAPAHHGWVYNYQSLLTGISALVAALITVHVMRQHADAARADEADGALTRYAIAIINVMEKCQAATPPAADETLEDAIARFREFQATSDDPILRAAMMDGVLGDDRRMVALFVQSCRFSALGRVYGREDERHANMVWPLYIALTEAITSRQSLLRSGLRVTKLRSMSLINHEESAAAFVEGRAPRISLLIRQPR